MHIYLEIIISLIGLYIVFSIINSAIVEGIGQIINERGKFLRIKLEAFFSGAKDDSKNFVHELYDHILIKAFKKNNQDPSYIDKRIFAQSFLELLFEEKVVTDEHGNTVIDQNKNPISTLSIAQDKMSILPEELAKSLDFILNKIPAHVTNKLDYLQKEIEELYEAYMDRVTSWYKQKMRLVLGIVGVIFAVLFNLDSVNFYDILKKNDAVRANQTQFAMLLNERQKAITIDHSKLRPYLTPAGIDSLKNRDFLKEVLLLNEEEAKLVESASLGIGPLKTSFSFSSIIGYLLTGLALSFGSTFWFGLLKKMIGK